ncbi:MAG: hypothetical protein LBE47_03315, partial [Methanomassiliicoccaceae archaeon]|nr:hypothetical protein [Methanomassiliicoccaceae archaeon]
FYLEISKALTVRADTQLTSGKSFLRWQDDNEVIISFLPSMTMAATHTLDIYLKAVYADADDFITITLVQTGGANAVMKYEVNGNEFTYTEPFSILKIDTLVLITTDTTTHTFLRWHDGTNVLSSDPTSKGLSVSSYGAMVTFTAAFARNADAVEIELTSSPGGAKLYYTVGDFLEAEYTGRLYVTLTETLSVRADTAHTVSGTEHMFVRWMSGTTIASVYDEMKVTLTAPSMSLEAVYADTSAGTLRTWEQTGGADADLTFTVNGTPFIYTGPFTVLRADTVVVSADVPSGYTFLRWQDGTSILATVPTGLTITPTALDAYREELTLTASFALTDDVIEVTLDSNMTADLYFKIGDLPEIPYNGKFLVGRSETLTITAGPASSTGEEFIRWMFEGSIIAATVSYDVVFTSDKMLFTALYADPATIIEIDFLWDGPVDADITYKIGGFTFTYNGMPFKAFRTDVVEIYAEASEYTFMRWHDGTNVVSLSAAYEIPDLSVYGTAVTFKAVFALTADLVTVTVEMADGAGTIELYIEGDLIGSYTSSFSFMTIPSWDVEMVVVSINAAWEFSHWIANGSEIRTASTQQLTFDEDAHVYARFLNETNGKFVESEGLLLGSPSQPLTGVTEWSYYDNGVLITRTDNGWAPKDAVITFTAYDDPTDPTDPYVFLYWMQAGGAGGASQTIEVTSEEDIFITAYFAHPSEAVQITVVIEGRGSVEISIVDGPTFIYTEPFMVWTYDRVAKLAVESESGWAFSHWVVDGEEDRIRERAERSFGNDITLYVVFEQIPDAVNEWFLWILTLFILFTLLLACYLWFIILRDSKKEEGI